MSHPQAVIPAAARAPIYALLARIFLYEVDADLVTTLRQPDVADVLEQVVPGCADYLAAWNQAAAAAAAEEYAALFLIPNGVSPFASRWIPGEHERVGAQVTAFVSRVLDALGLESSGAARWGQLPLDHIGLLFDVAGTALSNRDPAAIALGERVEREVLAPWVTGFARALDKRAQSPIYQAAARLLQAVFGPRYAA